MEHLALFILYVGYCGLPWDMFLRPFCVFSLVKIVASIFNKNWVYSSIIRLEAFAATDFNKVFSGRQPRQIVKFLHRSRDWLLPHLQGATDDLTNKTTTELTEKQVDVPQSVYPFLRVTTSLFSVTDTLKYNWDCAYANEFPVAVEDLNVKKTENHSSRGSRVGHKFGRKAFWDLNPNWSYLRLDSRRKSGI
jgi:hypothetical protein